MDDKPFFDPYTKIEKKKEKSKSFSPTNEENTKKLKPFKY